MPDAILALDQGTTSSRAILFDVNGQPLGSAQQEFEQIYPSPGHVEHDPEAIWASQLATARQAIASAGVTAEDIAGIGITNQRETTLLWERDTGRPIGNAIVWQSRITTPLCRELKSSGLETLFREKTGLPIDPYFSGTKVRHLLDQHGGLRQRAERGEVLFGTIDSYLVWRLTGGTLHVTDVSNASRTLMFNIHTLDWDDELLAALDVPRAMLPAVRSSSEVYGETYPNLFSKSIPISGIAGDQQAATFGQACFAPGDMKNTYGTGCFLLMNTGSQAIASENGLLTTIGWKIGEDVTYCLEGSIFIGGAVVQWLRDGLGLMESAADTDALAASVEGTDDVWFVPAFVGLGAPRWDPDARGTIIGITRGTTAAHIVRAALESMAWQTRDVVEVMRSESGLELGTLKVDGGATANNLLMQIQADTLGTRVARPIVQETTALGAAYLAGLAVGFWNSTSQITENWGLDRDFEPAQSVDTMDQLYTRWKQAVERSLNWADE